MKALTLTQPWATLVVEGAKEWETRSWRTSFRGPLAIHAAKGFPRWAIEICFEEPFASTLLGLGYPTPGDLPTAAIIGAVWMNGCIRTGQVSVSEPEKSFGDFGIGRYMWQLGTPYKVDPIPYKGALGLFNVPGIGIEDLFAMPTAQRLF